MHIHPLMKIFDINGSFVFAWFEVIEKEKKYTVKQKDHASQNNWVKIYGRRNIVSFERLSLNLDMNFHACG